MTNFSFNTKSKTFYEEIDPIPQRGRKKCLNSVLFGGLVICIGGIVVVFLVNLFLSKSVDNNVLPDVPANETDEIIVDGGQLKSASRNIQLGAPAPDDGNPGSSLATTTTKTPSSINNAVAANTTASPQQENVILELDQGSVLGKRMRSRARREYLAFLGIPYAKPPIGNLRFLPPVEAEPWNGTLDATNFRSQCMQQDKYNTVNNTSVGSEDCLYINIYTPKTLEAVKKRFDFRRFPVLVYIHGGGMWGNAGRYGADYFMDEDVVLVHFNYRLGVLGWLNTNDTNARGNQALKDQTMALQWVKDNIKKFGGNNRKVTIFGNSYGAMHATMHMLSPMSKGLFHRAISQSGTELMPGPFVQDPLTHANALGQKLNCTMNTTAELVSCFRNTSAETLIMNSYTMIFAASAEPPGEGEDDTDTFFPDAPLKLLQDGQIHKVPAIFGVQSGEGLGNSLSVLSSPNLTKLFNDNWELLAVPMLDLKTSPTLKDPEGIANAAREFYLGNQNLSRDVESNFTAMFGDRRFTHPAKVFATFLLEKLNGNRRGRGRRNRNSNANNVYLYYFNEEPEKSYGDPIVEAYGSDEFLGAGHADEIQFLLPYAQFPYISLDSPFGNFSQMMVRFWTTFADTGKPTGGQNKTEWKPITKDQPYEWLEITQEPKMINFLQDRMIFWDSFNLTDLYV